MIRIIITLTDNGVDTVDTDLEVVCQEATRHEQAYGRMIEESIKHTLDGVGQRESPPVTH